jgi:hypothetical protein
MSHTGKRAEDYLVGEQLWEGDYSAGVIVSKMQCPERSCRVFMLLRDEKNRYTIYSAVKDAVCMPTLSRRIPEAVVHFMFMQTFMGVTLPEKISESVDERTPVPKKNRK